MADRIAWYTPTADYAVLLPADPLALRTQRARGSFVHTLARMFPRVAYGIMHSAHFGLCLLAESRVVYSLRIALWRLLTVASVDSQDP